MTEETATANIVPVSPENTRVGMVGLGDMGTGIATAIVRRFPMVGFDLRPQAVQHMVSLGAQAGQSLADVADRCEVVVLVVLNDKQVNQVVGELLGHPGKIHTIIVSSTVLPGTVIALAERAGAIGIDLIDAPVSGGAEKSSRGIITVLVGGEDRAVKRCWPILEAFGKRLFHLGPVGAGSAVKLANNLLSLGGNVLVLEAMELARAYGVTEEDVTEVISTGTGDSRIIRTWGRLDRARRGHTLAGTPALYEAFSKDVKAAAQAAEARGVTLSVAGFIGGIMGEKMQARDLYLEANGLTGTLPQCRICGSELASPFREAGVHPECAYEEIQEAATKAD